MDNIIDTTYSFMRYESNRLRSFQMDPPWPNDRVDFKKLAKAGFFYAFSEDRVHCAFCHGVVCRWEHDDDPMTEHARHFTTCPFIMGGEVGNIPLGEDPIPGPKRPRAYDVCGPYPNFPPSDPRYIEERYINDSSWSISREQSNDGNVRHESQPIPPSLDNHNHDPESAFYQHNFIAQLEDEAISSSSSTTSNSSDVSSTIQSTGSAQEIESRLGSANQSSSQDNNPNNDNIGICKICFSNIVETFFFPCRHSICCLSCAQRFNDCPLCRKTITTTLRIYL